MIQKILEFFRKTPKSHPVNSFTFPSGNSKIHFSDNWEIMDHGDKESDFTFVNSELDGILYATEFTNENPDYQYSNEEALEMDSENDPELVNISRYGTVFFQREDKQAKVTYKHFSIGSKRTLLRFTWMTPYPNDQHLNTQIEQVLNSTELN